MPHAYLGEFFLPRAHFISRTARLGFASCEEPVPLFHAFVHEKKTKSASIMLHPLFWLSHINVFSVHAPLYA